MDSATALRLTRTYAAPPEKVYAAWTDPQALKRWFAPSDDFQTPEVEADVRVGGRYRIVMRSPDGEWHRVERPEMDCGLVVVREGETARKGEGEKDMSATAASPPLPFSQSPTRVRTLPMADVKRGDLIVVGHHGTRVPCADATNHQASTRRSTC